MADTKGSDSKPNEGKTGPVRPPVLDMKAREASDAKPEVKADAAKPDTAKPEAAKSEPAKSEPAKPQTAKADTTKTGPARPDATRQSPARPATTPSPRGFGIGAAIAGGVLGLAGAYGLAWFGLWPTTPAPAPPADPRLAQFATAIPELETVTQTTQSELAALNQRINALEAAEPAEASEPVDLSGVQDDIAELAARIDSLPTTPAPAADTGELETLRTELAALGTRLDEVAARLGTLESGLRTLDAAVNENSAALAGQPSDIGAVLQLPLILSGFETAFATGRPYATELGALRAAIPDAAVPTAIANNAETGLTRPDVIASRFASVLPDMLAGRPADPDAEWTQGALDWFRSAIALRPAGEIEGETPEALMSRLENAIARRDFVTAETLIAALPAPMRAAGGELPAMVAEQAEATRFLDTLRTSALSGEVTQ